MDELFCDELLSWWAAVVSWDDESCAVAAGAGTDGFLLVVGRTIPVVGLVVFTVT